jgi:hypothetical protein
LAISFLTLSVSTPMTPNSRVKAVVSRCAWWRRRFASQVAVTALARGSVPGDATPDPEWQNSPGRITCSN